MERDGTLRDMLKACANGPRGEGGFGNPWEFPWLF